MQLFVKKYHPDTILANRAVQIFSDNADELQNNLNNNNWFLVKMVRQATAEEEESTAEEEESTVEEEE